MKIYTSYFGNYKNFPDNVKVIQIARMPVKNGSAHWIELAPSEKLLKAYKNNQIDKYVYSIKYKEELTNKFGSPEQCLKWLEARGGGQDLLLCCYEAPGDFCHRHVLTEWLGTGTEI